MYDGNPQWNGHCVKTGRNIHYKNYLHLSIFPDCRSYYTEAKGVETPFATFGSILEHIVSNVLKPKVVANQFFLSTF